jgi:hypothetical protein
MSSRRISLLGGPVFFALWFVGANVLFFAVGGDTEESPLPGPDEFPEVVLTNEASMYLGATLLGLAGIALLWFGVGMKDRVGSGRGLDLVVVVATAAISVLLFIEAGLVTASVGLAEEAPEFSWMVHQLSGAVGFETFLGALVGGVAVTGVLAAADKNSTPRWFWWFTVAIGVILAVTGVLEGVNVIPPGRFAIFFGLWAAIAGLSLLTSPQDRLKSSATEG